MKKSFQKLPSPFVPLPGGEEKLRTPLSFWERGRGEGSYTSAFLIDDVLTTGASALQAVRAVAGSQGVPGKRDGLDFLLRTAEKLGWRRVKEIVDGVLSAPA